MPVKNKKKYTVYLTEESAEIVKSFVDMKPGEGGMSALIDDYIIRMASTLKGSGIKTGEKLKFSNIIKMVIAGIRNSP